MLEKIKGNLGLGCMRLPMLDGEVDKDAVNRMVDKLIGEGFNYFDTAHGYIDGKSEGVVKDCIASRYDREDFVLANKLSDWFFESEADIRPLFESQLRACGVEYFDFYLFHALNRESYEKHKRCRTFEIVKELCDEGKIRHIAMSFHDSAEVLDMILREQDFIEAVQLQINYLDSDDPTVQSVACYEVARKHGKGVMVMEPLKGGALAKLPEAAIAEFEALGDASPVSYGLRYAAGFPGVFMVLSGMGSVEMIESNIKALRPLVPLDERELAAAYRARDIIRNYRSIPCTACKYCAEVCPKHIPIASLFALYNEYALARASKREICEELSRFEIKPADCIECGACEGICPQSITIRERLKKIDKL